MNTTTPFKGCISHQGYIVTCPCGQTETLFAKTLKDAKREAEEMGWHCYIKTGWNCPACDKREEENE